MVLAAFFEYFPKTFAALPVGESRRVFTPYFLAPRFNNEVKLDFPVPAKPDRINIFF